METFPPPPPAPAERAHEYHFDDDDFDSGRVRKFIILTIIIFLILGAAIGGGLWYFSHDEAQAPEGPTDAVPPPLEEAGILIDAQEGGVIALDGASVEIPPNALAQDTRLVLKKVAEGDVTDVYHLAPAMRFLIPVTVRIPYKAEIDDTYLEVEYRLDDGSVVPVRYQVDRAEKKLIAQVTEF